MIRDRQELEAALFELESLSETVGAIGEDCKKKNDFSQYESLAVPHLNRVKEISAEIGEYTKTLSTPPPTPANRSRHRRK